MVLTSWSAQVVKWHKSLQELTALCSPTKPKYKRKLGLSYLKPYLKTDVPRLVDYYEPTYARSPADWTTSLALFNTIVANKASTVSPLTTNDTPIVLDSGCSVAICNDILDFPNGFTPAPPHAGIRGIGSKLPVLGHGLICWRMPDNNGTCVTIEVNGLYVPQCPVNLLPPQQLVCAEGMYKTNCTIVGHDHCRVYYQGHIINFPYDVCSNFPSANNRAVLSNTSPQCLRTPLQKHPTKVPKPFYKAHRTYGSTPTSQELVIIYLRSIANVVTL
jgi:hypothetical protein